LPATMEQLEQEVEALQEKISAPEFYAQDQEKISLQLELLANKEQELEVCFERWEELESLK